MDNEFGFDDLINQDNALIISGSSGQVRQAKGNSNMMVQFEKKKVPNLKATSEDGIVYDEKVYIRIRRKGDKFAEVHRPIRESDKRQWPMQWRAFAEGNSEVKGTPIGAMLTKGLISYDQKLQLDLLRIQTVEDLANISGATIDNLGVSGGQLKKLANAYLADYGVKVSVSDVKSLMEKVTQLEAKLNAEPETEAAPAPAPKKKKIKKVKKLPEDIVLDELFAEESEVQESEAL